MVGELHGKVAFVTGGARGIGRAVALRFAEAGANVVLHFGRSKDDAQTVAGLVRDLGLKCHVLQADLGDRGAVDDLAERSEAAFGHVDVLVNNAAIADGPLDGGGGTDFSEKLLAWDRVLDVNARAPWALAARLAPGMAARGGGSIVNVASVSGLYAMTDAPMYSLSKAMLLHMTRQFALRFAPNVRVNAIAPGWTATDFGGGFIMDPEFQRRAVRHVPLGRVAEAAEVAEATFHLATASYATGVVLPLDGGMRAELP